MLKIANNEDGEAIFNLTANAGVFKSTEIKILEELWSDYIKSGSEESGYYFIVFRENGKILGYACYGPHPLTDATFDLFWIAVDKESQGKGVGQALLNKTEKDVKDLGGYLIVIETSSLDHYSQARRFYTAAGYTFEARIQDFYGPGDDIVYFTKHV